MSRVIYKGAKEYVAMRARHLEGLPFTIESVAYEIRDSRHNVLDSGDGFVESDYIVVMLFDTTLTDANGEDLFRVLGMNQNTYWVYFKVSIAGLPKLKVDRVMVDLRE